MSQEQQGGRRRTCFVVMGFGKKTDFETGRTLDLDKTYRTIIKPAVTAAGFECVRADEIVHSGLIDVPMYEQLLKADVVVADLSTSNKNAYYELGVRHALRPYTTVIICEDGIQTFPFDLNHVVVRKYRHMGDGIDFEEVERFRGVLTEAILEVSRKTPPSSDSPVYTFINNLTPPALSEALEAVAEAASKSAPGVRGLQGGEPSATHSEMMQEAEDARTKAEMAEAKQKGDSLTAQGDFLKAKSVLSDIRDRMRRSDPQRPEDPYIVQQLALVTYKSRHPTPREALEEARSLLLTLDPLTSNDTQTLGLWGAVHKRLWDETHDRGHLDEAVRGYERGFSLRNDYYNGINLAFLLNVRAADSCHRSDTAATPEEATEFRAEAVASFVHAVKIRRAVIDICRALLDGGKLSGEQKYWVLATLAEAHLGTGDEAAAARDLEEALALKPAQWMQDSTREQMDALRRLLANSPLRYINSDLA